MNEVFKRKALSYYKFAIKFIVNYINYKNLFDVK